MTGIKQKVRKWLRKAEEKCGGYANTSTNGKRLRTTGQQIILDARFAAEDGSHLSQNKRSSITSENSIRIP